MLQHSGAEVCAVASEPEGVWLTARHDGHDSLWQKSHFTICTSSVPLIRSIPLVLWVEVTRKTWKERSQGNKYLTKWDSFMSFWIINMWQRCIIAAFCCTLWHLTHLLVTMFTFNLNLLYKVGLKGCTEVRWSAPWPHSKRVPGLNPSWFLLCGVTVLPEYVWVLSGSFWLLVFVLKGEESLASFLQ